MMAEKEIDEKSPDYEAMFPYWRQVNTIIDGISAMRSAGKIYLPKFPNESDKDYAFRLSTSTMTNVYRDIVENLANKPFSEEVSVKEESASSDIINLVEDIDGNGNHLGVFLYNAFFSGINDVVSWILVDYPRVDRNAIKTIAQERAAGVRPYWVLISALNVLEVRSKKINGIQKLVYVKILEKDNEGDKIREFIRPDAGPIVWRVHVQETSAERMSRWRLEEEGTLTINEIPMVPFITGRRKGNSWQFYPAMSDAADLQVELYQQETEKKYARTLTCFPMLAANGIKPRMIGKGDSARPAPIPVGPMAVLYAPPNDDGSSGSWDRIAADAQAMQFLQSDIIQTIQQMREIGRQPLTAQSGNVTRISASFAASKSNTAVGAWALGLKDAAEQAFVFTAMWMNDKSRPEVEIFTDFPVETDSNPVPEQLTKMRENGDISQNTYWSEMKRNGVLSSNFDADKELEKILLEYPNGDPNNTDRSNSN